MILAESYTEQWIHSHLSKKGFEKINPPLVEKMIHALGLVEALAANGLEFIFKGGTSLILLIAAPGRFSIDIDIITKATKEEIEAVLKNVCIGTPFKDYKLNEKRSYQPGIPKAHYSLTYNSGLTGKEDHILLDILFDDHSYPKTITVPVISEWLKTDATVIPVTIPTHESITGDKLTAFAPNTTGVPYRKGKELEIVKQLYDLGRLFHEITDIAVVSESFRKTALKEMGYRGIIGTPDIILDDIINTSILIAKRERNKEEPHLSNFKEIQAGLLQFKSYQVTSYFRIDEAIAASAKAALLAAMIKTGYTGDVASFTAGLKKEDYLIQHLEYNFLNKLRVEALFYWRKTIEIITNNNRPIEF
jgi:hypothetical protein